MGIDSRCSATRTSCAPWPPLGPGTVPTPLRGGTSACQRIGLRASRAPRARLRGCSGAPGSAGLAYPGESVPKGCSVLKRFLPAAIVLLGLFVVGLGIASATLWKPLPTVRAVATPADAGNVVITAPGVLDLVSSEVTVRASAPGSRVVLVIGRDSDVAAWAAGSPHLLVTGLSSWTKLATDSAAASVPQASASASAGDTASPTASADPTASVTADGGGASAAATAGSVTTGGVAPDPSGSDMWLVQANGKDSATLTWASRPGRWSALAVSVGTSPTAPELELSWPHPVTTPWFAPAMAVGGALLLLGLGLLALMRAQTRSPELVEAWRGGVRVPAGIGAEQAGADAEARAPGKRPPRSRRQGRSLSCGRVS